MLQEMELLIIQLNSIILLTAYIILYPVLVGNNEKKWAFYGTLVVSIPLMLVGNKFWGSDQTFSIYFFEVNWFWFTLVTYYLIEIPIAIIYVVKMKIYGTVTKQTFKTTALVIYMLFLIALYIYLTFFKNHFYAFGNSFFGNIRILPSNERSVFYIALFFTLTIVLFQLRAIVDKKKGYWYNPDNLLSIFFLGCIIYLGYEAGILNVAATK